MEKLLNERFYHSKYRGTTIMAIDIILALISFALAIMFKSDFTFRLNPGYGEMHYLLFVFAVVIFYGLALLVFQIPKSLWSFIGVRELIKISVCSFVASIAVLIFSLLTMRIHFSFILSVCFLGGIITTVAMMGARALYRLLRGIVRGGEKEAENALIIGAGSGGYLLLKEMEKNRLYNANVIGFVDDLKDKKIVAGKKVLGTTKQIPKLVAKYHVTKVFTAIPSARKSDLQRILDICQPCGVEVKVMKKSDSMIVDSSVHSFPVESISISDLLGRDEVDLDISQISAYLTEKTVLVTGAGGSIGSVLCKQIARFKPKTLVLIDIYENNMYELSQEFIRDKMHMKLSPDIAIHTIVASVRDMQTLNTLFTRYKPDVVFHAAAHKHVPLMETSPLEAIKNNVFGTKNTIEASIAHGVDRFIMISTDKAVNPTNVMGASKRIAEVIMQSYAGKSSTKLAAVRFGNVLGSNGSVIPLFEKQIASGGPITLTNWNVERFFMTIPEAAQLVMQAGCYANEGEIFVLDMGKPVKILELAEKMIKLSGLTPYKDIDIIEIGLRPGEKMYEELSLSEERLGKTKHEAISLVYPMEVENILPDILQELRTLIKLNAETDKVHDTLMEMVQRTNYESGKNDCIADGEDKSRKCIVMGQ